MNKPKIVQTIAGEGGWATVYVSFKSIVAAEGALDALPTIDDVNPSLAASSLAAIDYTGTIDGVTYAAGEMFTFRATRVGSNSGIAAFDINYATAQRQDTERVAVRVQDYQT